MKIEDDNYILGRQGRYARVCIHPNVPIKDPKAYRKMIVDLRKELANSIDFETAVLLKNSRALVSDQIIVTACVYFMVHEKQDLPEWF